NLDRSQLGDDPLHEAVEEGLLVPDVPVDGGDGHAELGRQGPDGEPLDPVALEDLEGGVEDLVARQRHVPGAGSRPSGSTGLTLPTAHVTMLHWYGALRDHLCRLSWRSRAARVPGLPRAPVSRALRYLGPRLRHPLRGPHGGR